MEYHVVKTTTHPTSSAVDLSISVNSNQFDSVILSASLRFPLDILAGQSVTVLVCWPGGSYGKAYWDMHVPDRSDFSFAEYAASRGFVVVSADFLGVGSSTRPDEAHLLTFPAISAVSASFVTSITAALREGTLTGGLAPVTIDSVVGIGHSLGGYLVLAEQALFSSYDAVAALGSTHGVMERSVPGSASAYRAAPEQASELAQAHAHAFFSDEQWATGYGASERTQHHGWLHGPDIPEDVLAADDAEIVDWPCQAYVEALTPGLTASYAQRINAPVFVGFGEHDVPEHPHDDVGLYESSNDVTLIVLPGSYHCHNFSSRRTQFWDRICLWATEQTYLGRGETS